MGALGIPAPFLGTLGSERYLFHDTEPSSIVKHARHAVAIDENRLDFEPSLWSKKEGVDIKQVWFAGVHTDIGGGYPDRNLGDIPGQWLAREAQTLGHGQGLAFEPHFVDALRPDYRGKQHNEYKGFYRIMRRSTVRQVEPVIHSSVKQRWEDPQLRYRSKALKNLLDQLANDWNNIQLVE